MSKLYSSRQIQKVLDKLGFFFASQKGSHAKFKDARGNTVILPMGKKEIPDGTFRSVLKQADITLQTFKENL
jgi:predicted RNA binding protein YcfA (HicA-like mRNA interferase family)